jgi:hypothetical protein
MLRLLPQKATYRQMTDGPNKVVQSSRRVIERKLLARLDDVGTVAILASKEDLDLLIRALGRLGLPAQEMREGLEQLRREAFWGHDK